MDRDIKSTRSEWRHIIYNEVKNLGSLSTSVGETITH